MTETYEHRGAPSIREAPNCPRNPLGPIAQVANFVAHEMALQPAVIYGRLRTRRPSTARNLTAWIAYKKHGKSSAQIGRALGGRDHTTIIDARQRVEHLRVSNPKFAAWSDDLLARAP